MSKKMIIIIVAVVALVLMAAMIGFGLLLWSKVSTMGQPAEVAATEEGEEAEIEETSGTLYPLETFIVNLADQEGKRYLRITMNLELSAELLPSTIDAKLPQVRDRILMLLPSKTFADINSIDGKEILREELIEEINEIAPQGQVMNIYFTEFVIQ